MYNKFMKLFNKCFPYKEDTIPFEDRFEVITVFKNGYDPNLDLVEHSHGYSEIYYKLERLGNQRRDVSLGWRDESMIFVHPDIPYQHEWLHNSHGGIIDYYHYHHCADSYRTYIKGIEHDSTGWTEHKQYVSDMESFRKPISKHYDYRNVGASDLKNYIKNALTSKPDNTYDMRLASAGIRNLSIEDIDKNLSSNPTLTKDKINYYSTIEVSYIFYDTLRRGVYFHVMLDERLPAMHSTVAVKSAEIADYYKSHSLERYALPVYKKKFPFLIMLNAQWPDHSTGRDIGQRQLYQHYMSKISEQYMSVFQKWLTLRCKGVNQVEFTTDADVTLIQDAGNIETNATTYFKRNGHNIKRHNQNIAH